MWSSWISLCAVAAERSLMAINELRDAARRYALSRLHGEGGGRSGVRSPLGGSVISGNSIQVRRRPVRKIEHHLVDVTPAPPFRWIIGFDDRVPGSVKVFCRVAIGRLIAAADMTAGPADPQMQPGIAQFQAFFTPRSTRKDVADCRNMSANRCHAVVALRLICRRVVRCKVAPPQSHPAYRGQGIFN